jgi:formylglycine-generating enzyme required for sulfatase activity
MKRLLALLVFAGASVQAGSLLEYFGSGENSFSIEFQNVGNENNPADLNATASDGRYVGSVNYTYGIGKYEISRSIIQKANAASSLNLTMADLTNYGGNGPNRPATGLSWIDTAKFVNWLNTSQGYQAAYKIEQQTVASVNVDVVLRWGSNENGFDSQNQFRNSNARYVLPSADEWHKAAFYDPNKNGGGYWLYPNQNDTVPTKVSGGLLNGSVVNGQIGPADVDNAGGTSAYGTMAQGGNASEFTETFADFNGTDFRRMVDPMWGNAMDAMLQSSYNVARFGGEDGIGFRVASVPEPSALSLLAVGLGGLAMMRRRRS